MFIITAAKVPISIFLLVINTISLFVSCYSFYRYKLYRSWGQGKSNQIFFRNSCISLSVTLHIACCIFAVLNLSLIGLTDKATAYRILVWILGLSLFLSEVIFIDCMLWFKEFLPKALRPNSNYDRSLNLVIAISAFIINFITLFTAKHPMAGNYYTKIELIVFVGSLLFVIITLIIKISTLIKATINNKDNYESIKKLLITLYAAGIVVFFAFGSVILESIIFADLQLSFTYDGVFDGFHVEPLMMAAPFTGSLLNVLCFLKSPPPPKEVSKAKAQISMVESVVKPISYQSAGATQMANEAIKNWDNQEALE